MKQKIDDFIKAIDLEVGWRIYNARIASALSQKDVANSIGISVQQLYKYEKGINKIPLGRLILLSHKLNKDFTDFYSNLNINKQEHLLPEGVSDFEVAKKSQFHVPPLKSITKITDYHYQQQKSLLVG